MFAVSLGVGNAGGKEGFPVVGEVHACGSLREAVMLYCYQGSRDTRGRAATRADAGGGGEDAMIAMRRPWRHCQELLSVSVSKDPMADGAQPSIPNSEFGHLGRA